MLHRITIVKRYVAPTANRIKPTRKQTINLKYGWQLESMPQITEKYCIIRALHSLMGSKMLQKMRERISRIE